VRRWIKSNGLTNMWTLTFASAPQSRAEVVRKLRWFFRRLQAKYGRLPLLAVIERGTQGTKRLHVHLAVDRWLNIHVLREAWGHGHVWVGDGRKCPGAPGWRRLASYLSKYLTKQVEAEAAGEIDREPGAHRYLTTQGFAVPVLRVKYLTARAAITSAARRFGDVELVIGFGDQLADPVWGYWILFDDRALVDPPWL
jgi:hypothetical protein